MADFAKQDGASRAMRLDPYQKQHQMRLGNTSYKISTNGAVVKKWLPSGLPVTMAVPARAFKGVAAQASEDCQGNITITLELLHHDPQLCVPLLRASDMKDVAADWHSWSRLMNLPMLLLGLDGKTSALHKTLGEIMVEAPWARRKRITSAKHRPNFLRRRRRGAIGNLGRLSANEIIARD